MEMSNEPDGVALLVVATKGQRFRSPKSYVKYAEHLSGRCIHKQGNYVDIVNVRVHLFDLFLYAAKELHSCFMTGIVA